MRRLKECDKKLPVPRPRNDDAIYQNAMVPRNLQKDEEITTNRISNHTNQIYRVMNTLRLTTLALTSWSAVWSAMRSNFLLF